MAARPLATVAAVALFCFLLSFGEARLLRAGLGQIQAPPPAAAVAAGPSLSPLAPPPAPPPADPPPAAGSAPPPPGAAGSAPPPPGAAPPPGAPPPPPPPCPNQPAPALPVDALVKQVKVFGDTALAGANMEPIHTKARKDTISKIHGAADELNPLKHPEDPEKHAKEAIGPLEEVRKELKGNFDVMHTKAEEEAAEVLRKVKESIHNATETTVEATFEKVNKENQELYAESKQHADDDIKHSMSLADKALEATHLTMEAIAKLQKADGSLPWDEINMALAESKKAQTTSTMFTNQALGTKQVVEKYMMLDYMSHHDVVVADKDQGQATKIAFNAESQASTNSADIKVLKASIKEAKEEVVESLQKTSKLGNKLVNA